MLGPTIGVGAIIYRTGAVVSGRAGQTEGVPVLPPETRSASGQVGPMRTVHRFCIGLLQNPTQTAVDGKNDLA